MDEIQHCITKCMKVENTKGMLLKNVQIQLEEHFEDQRREISVPLKKHYWSL